MQPVYETTALITTEIKQTFKLDVAINLELKVAVLMLF